MQGMSEATFKRTLYIDNLPPFFVEKDIRDYIESHSFDVGRIALFRYGSSSKNWGCSKGHALVVLKDEQQAQAAITILDGKVPPNAAFLTGKEESGKKGKVRQMKLRVTRYRPSKRVLQPSGQASPVCVSELRYPDLAGREISEDDVLSGAWDNATSQGSDADLEGMDSPPAQPATPVGQHKSSATQKISCTPNTAETQRSTAESVISSLDSPSSTGDNTRSTTDPVGSPCTPGELAAGCPVSVKLCPGLRIKTISDQDPVMCLDFSTPNVKTPDTSAPPRRECSDKEDNGSPPHSAEKLRKQLLQKEMALEELMVQLAVEKTECMRLEDEWSTAQVKADELQSTADELLQQNAELRGEIRSLKAEVARRAALHVQLEERLDLAKDRISKLVQEKSMLSSQLCGTQQQVHLQEDKIAHLQQDLVSLRLLVWQQVMPANGAVGQLTPSLGLTPFASS